MSRFEKVINRRNSCSRKWDSYLDMGYDCDILPLWVADMDFETLPEITQAILERAGRGVFGYTMIEPGTTLAIKEWMQRRFEWDIEEHWIIHTPGVVFAFNLAIQLFTKEGDAIMISNPVYPPFARSIKNNNRVLVDHPLLFNQTHYEFDMKEFENQLVSGKVKLYIFCNPHNPVGKRFTKEEINQIGLLCLKHNVLIISDEIHQDFVYSGYKHLPFTKVNPLFAKNTIICTSPSKTFNLAGMQFANLMIEDDQLRETFKQGMEKLGIHITASFSSLACKIAYTHGDEYVDELVEHVERNLSFMKEFFEKYMPLVKIIEPQSLYLIWVDFSSFGLAPKDLENFMIQEAKVWFNEGYTFGGDGFERVNVACPLSTLQEALCRVRDAAKRRNLIE